MVCLTIRPHILMRLNSELKLRKLGSHYMIVDSCAGRANIANVYVLNATAAWLWEQVEQKEFDAEALVSLLCDYYDVTRDRAAADIDRLLSIWQEAGLIHND